MSLLNYWPSDEEVNNCIKHEAEGVHDAVLLAVHRPTPLSYKEVSSGQRFSASETELFDYLMTQDVPSGAHIIPLTGASGVGKSHMVRILNAKLQSLNEDDKYVVIRIPKSASLRKVVELILAELPNEQYAQVRSEFAKALTEDLNMESAVIRFQGGLDISIGQLAKELESRVRANPRDSVLKEQWGHASYLPKFMGDPVLVDHFREKVFSRFVSRAIAGQQEFEEGHIVKDFVPKDLLIPDAIDISKAATQTNVYYTRNLLAGDGEGMRVAAQMLNDHMIVDQTIRQLFNLHQSLGGMTLQDVIIEIRRLLLDQGRELVIFVEDFKALTGIQDILLKVLIQEGVRDGVKQLATMRSVIAVTDGYLDSEDTIATRAKREWKVESELSSSEEVLGRTKSLVAAYLNAARWGLKDLVRRFEANRDVDHTTSQWINPYHAPDTDVDTSILASFGYQDEIPLFPYTEKAIERLAKVALTRNNALVFTPRFVIDNVLRSMLLQGRPAFEKGEFPPPSIRVPSSRAEVAQWLGSLRVSTEIRERYQRIVSIWGDNPISVSEVGYIPKEVFDAFKLDPPDIEYKEPPKTKRKDDGEISESSEAQKPDDDSLQLVLEQWSQGHRMPQAVANQIRKGVASALNDRIDWNAERSAKTPIKPAEISIPNAAGEAAISKNPILVADDHTDPSGKFRSELAAVTRLYHLNLGNPNYLGADDDLVWVGNLADRLMPTALSIVRSENIKKLTAVVRLLQTNSQILGLHLRSTTPASLAAFMFGEVSDPSEALEDQKATFLEWNNLRKQAFQIRPALMDLAVSLCGSFQGTAPTPRAVDIIRVADAVESSEVGDLELSAELKNLLAPMSEVRVKAQVRRVIQEANSIQSKLVSELGKSFNKQEIVNELKSLADQMGGVWPTQDIGMGLQAFKNRCDDFKGVAIRDSMETLSKTVEDGADQIKAQQISWVGRLELNPLLVAENFTDTARRVIRSAQRQTVTLNAQFQGVDPLAEANEIKNLFDFLITELDSFTSSGDA